MDGTTTHDDVIPQQIDAIEEHSTSELHEISRREKSKDAALVDKATKHRARVAKKASKADRKNTEQGESTSTEEGEALSPPLDMGRARVGSDIPEASINSQSNPIEKPTKKRKIRNADSDIVSPVASDAPQAGDALMSADDAAPGDASEPVGKRRSRKAGKRPNDDESTMSDEPSSTEPADAAAASPDGDTDANVPVAQASGHPAEEGSAQPDGTELPTGQSDTASLEIQPHRVVEAILMATDAPMTPAKIASILGIGTARDIRQHIATLNEQYESLGMSIRIREIAGGYQIHTLPQYNTWLLKLTRFRQETKLTGAALETLSIIAYKQPCTRADVETIRGVAAGDMINRLREMNLVKIVGRAEDLGRPILYGTTQRFLETFGLPSLEDLPQVEALKSGAKMPKPSVAEVIEKPSEIVAKEPETSTEMPDTSTEA